MSNEHLELWDDLLIHGIGKGMDYGIDLIPFLDVVADALSTNSDPTATSTIVVVEFLFRQLAQTIAESDQLPTTFLEYANETMRSTYPPEPRNRHRSLWMLRQLAIVIENCPRESLSDFLKSLQDGLTLWFADEYSGFPETDYDDVRHYFR
jgi:hypothetical protein